MKKALCVILCILMLTSFSACRKNSVSGIEFETERLNIEVGEKRILVARALPTTADNIKISWESDDETIATVANGTVYGKKQGKCKVTAKTRDGGYEKTCEVVVRSGGLYVSADYNLSDEGYGVWKFDTINAALAAAEKKDNIYVEQGRYEEIVNLTKNVNMYGLGATIKGSFVIGHPTLGEPTNKILISGFAFIDNDVTPAIEIGNETENVTIENCTFYGTNTGITTMSSGESTAVKKVSIVDCKFSGYETAIKLNQYVAKGNIERNDFSDCRFSIFLQGSQKTNIKQNKIENSGFLYFKSARLMTQDIAIEENDVISPYNDEPFIVAKKGDIEKTQKLNLYSNKFFGTPVEIMTDREKLKLLSYIVVKNDITGEGDYNNIVLKK